MMQCPSCQHDNPPEAQFCSRCGSALATATTAPPAPPTGEAQAATETLSPAAAHAEASIRISTFSAVVGLFILGLLMIAVPTTRWLPWHLGALGLAPLGLGVAASLWLTGRRQWTGRLPSALGIVLIITGLIFVQWLPHLPFYLLEYGFGLDQYSEPNMLLQVLIFVMFIVMFVMSSGLAGSGIGLLLPWAFWRHFSYISTTGKLALVSGAVVGLGFYVTFDFSPAPLSLGLILISLLIGLPSVLISPIVRLSRES